MCSVRYLTRLHKKFLYHWAMVPLRSICFQALMIFSTFFRQTVPIIINSPHSGQKIPDDIAKIMTPEGLQLPDTDLFVDELYSFAPDLEFA